MLIDSDNQLCDVVINALYIPSDSTHSQILLQQTQNNRAEHTSLSFAKVIVTMFLLNFHNKLTNFSSFDGSTGKM